MKSQLIAHYRRYPKMQIRDMVKLIYQSEFAGGHLIRSEDESFDRIRQEYDRFAPCQEALTMPYEDIGYGLSRLHLYKDMEPSLSTVNRLFVATANNVKGSVERFEGKLNVLRQCCERGELPYDPDELEVYIQGYKEKGYPAVSHSEVYRDAYTPSYRIVKQAYCHYIAMFSTIDALLGEGKQVMVAIEGRSGAGKSTLSVLLDEVYDCNVFHMDDFFLSPDKKTEKRLSEVGGNVDYERFHDEVMVPLRKEQAFNYRPYDCRSGSLAQPIAVTPKALNIVEGVYSLHPTLSACYDLKVFLNIKPDQQSCRIMERSGAAMHQRFIKEWIPLENRYFDELHIADMCDLRYDVTRPDDLGC